MTAADAAGVGSATRTFPNSLGEAAQALRELVEPIGFGTKVKRAIENAAHAAGLPYWRAFDIWYGKARRLEDFERDQIADALAAKRREAARNELHELRTRILRLEALLARSDPDFHRPSIAAARDQILRLDGKDGAADRAGTGRRK